MISVVTLLSLGCTTAPPKSGPIGSYTPQGAAGQSGTLPPTGAGPQGTSPTAGTQTSTGTLPNAGTPALAGSNAGPAAGSAAPSVGTARTKAGFMNLAPEMLTPLDEAAATALEPPAPAGWNWFPIDGAICRDGSPAGLFVRFGTTDKLFIYYEGGGACNTKGFCHFNPANVNSAILGDGQTVITSALAAGAARQQPGVFDPGGVPSGMFDFANPKNPYKDWSAAYIPYCTGDVHFGTRRDATVPNTTEKQQFVGYLNSQKFIGHLVPTFKSKVSRVMLHGTSAGSFGAALNYSMIQDAFGETPVDVILDSGLPFDDEFMTPCMQKRWRELWGLDAALPPDCKGCFNENGGGLLGLADYLIEKHPSVKLGMISTTGDEVMRLFFSGGLKECANLDTIDPFEVTLGQILDPAIVMTEDVYTKAASALRAKYEPSGQLSTYFMSGDVKTFHQHVWRARFYEPVVGGKTIAQFVQDTMDGVIQQVGP